MLDKQKLVEWLKGEIMSCRIVGTDSDKAIEFECKRILERVEAGTFDKTE